jgi:murein DD-endopeptidase MepM/ murein hydrolase activator NlpD
MTLMRIFLLGLMIWLSAGCTAAPAVRAEPLPASADEAGQAAPEELAQDSPAPSETPTQRTAPTQSPATPVPSATPSPISLPAQKPAKPVFNMCSPLAWESIPELFEIVADPYNPPPENRLEERHHGVDFSHYSRKGNSSIAGEPIQAVLPGRVAAAIHDRLPYGNMLILETLASDLPEELAGQISLQPAQSLYVLYAHMQASPGVSVGDWILCGQEIGLVGKTGYNIVNEHLHLETRLGTAGVVFESMAFYTTTASQAEMDAYTRWRTSGEFRHFDPMKLFQAYLDWQAGLP